MACVQSSVTVGRSSVVAIVDHVPALHNTASINIFVFISSVPSSPLPATRDPSVCQDENRFLAPRFVLDQDKSQCPSVPGMLCYCSQRTLRMKIHSQVDVNDETNYVRCLTLLQIYLLWYGKNEKAWSEIFLHFLFSFEALDTVLATQVPVRALPSSSALVSPLPTSQYSLEVALSPRCWFGANILRTFCKCH